MESEEQQEIDLAQFYQSMLDIKNTIQHQQELLDVPAAPAPAAQPVPFPKAPPLPAPVPMKSQQPTANLPEPGATEVPPAPPAVPPPPPPPEYKKPADIPAAVPVPPVANSALYETIIVSKVPALTRKTLWGAAREIDASQERMEKIQGITRDVEMINRF